jgi:hypothetical protein
MTRRLLVFVVLPLCARAGADARAYDGVKDLRATGGDVTAEHHHDWKSHTAYVRVLDRAGKTLVERPSPALTTLWVSPDGAYVVGLSSIKSANPNQVFVLGRDGAYLHQESVRCSDPRLKGRECRESVSVAVDWYDDERPEIELALEGGRPAALTVNEARNWQCASPKPASMDAAAWSRLCPEPRRRLRLPLKSE